MVPASDGAGGLAPGDGDAPGFWPVTGEPGVVGDVGEVGEVGEDAAPPVLAPPVLLPPVPPELCASAMPPVRASAANVAQTRSCCCSLMGFKDNGASRRCVPWRMDAGTRNGSVSADGPRATGRAA